MLNALKPMEETKVISARVDDVKTFVHSSTQFCAIRKSCIPCHYKIFPTGTFCSVALPPNQRPEQCPRAKSGPYDGLYKPHHRVLTLGDGDFSFSLSIAKNVKFTTGCLVATSHESKEQLLTTYNAVGIKDILKQLDMRSITTIHDVDAMDISSTKAIEKRYYDAIIWNFPCVRAENGADGQSSEIEINRLLLSNFFLNVQDYLRPGTGQLHITHKVLFHDIEQLLLPCIRFWLQILMLAKLFFEKLLPVYFSVLHIGVYFVDILILRIIMP